jgi:hypothetical protein
MPNVKTQMANQYQSSKSHNWHLSLGFNLTFELWHLTLEDIYYGHFIPPKGTSQPGDLS